MLRCMLSALREIQKSSQESSQKSDQKIIEAMRHNPLISIRELHEVIGLSESGVKKIIGQLRGKGIIKRVGGAKGGHWVIIDTDDYGSS